MMKILRMWHENYAKKNGYFWLPCPVCGEHFGGHEWKYSIWGSDWGGTPNPGWGVCSRRCATDPRAEEAWRRRTEESEAANI
jgi:hypothetical protein